MSAVCQIATNSSVWYSKSPVIYIESTNCKQEVGFFKIYFCRCLRVVKWGEKTSVVRQIFMHPSGLDWVTRLSFSKNKPLHLQFLAAEKKRPGAEKPNRNGFSRNWRSSLGSLSLKGQERKESVGFAPPSSSAVFPCFLASHYQFINIFPIDMTGDFPYRIQLNKHFV